MSWQANNWVVLHSQHKGSVLLTLIMIANHADGDGRNSFPGYERLACECRVDKSTVKRNVSILEQSGELIIVKNRQGGRGRKMEFDLPYVRTGGPAPSAKKTKDKGGKMTSFPPQNEAEQDQKSGILHPFIGSEKNEKSGIFDQKRGAFSAQKGGISAARRGRARKRDSQENSKEPSAAALPGLLSESQAAADFSPPAHAEEFAPAPSANGHSPPETDQAYITRTLAAHPEWQAEYKRRIAGARHPIPYGAKILQSWEAGEWPDGLPSPAQSSGTAAVAGEAARRRQAEKLADQERRQAEMRAYFEGLPLEVQAQRREQALVGLAARGKSGAAHARLIREGAAKEGSPAWIFYEAALFALLEKEAPARGP